MGIDTVLVAQEELAATAVLAHQEVDRLGKDSDCNVKALYLGCFLAEYKALRKVAICLRFYMIL